MSVKIFCDICDDDMTNDQQPMEIKTVEPNVFGTKGEQGYVREAKIVCRHCSQLIKVAVAKITQDKKEDAKKV